MASEFIENVQRLEEMARFISKIGSVSLEEAVERVKTISDFIATYGDIAPMLEHLKEIEAKMYMFKEMMTLDEAAGYIGSSKSLLYKMTANRGITHYKPNGRVIYFDRKDLDELLRTNPVFSKKALERQAIAASMEQTMEKTRKKKGVTR